MPRKEQVAISRLRTRYTRATRGPKMKGVGSPLCPFCNTDLSVDHILWECKETENQRTNMDMNKEQWINGKKDMEKMMVFSSSKSPRKCKYTYNIEYDEQDRFLLHIWHWAKLQ
jgi:hypothetical protein